MSDTQNCQVPDCKGVLDTNTFPVKTGCSSSSPCRACSECGRVHSYDGGLMSNRRGSAVYLREGKLELVPYQSQLVK